MSGRQRDVKQRRAAGRASERTPLNPSAPDRRERAVLVGCAHGDGNAAAEESLAELQRLAETAGVDVVGKALQTLRRYTADQSATKAIALDAAGVSCEKNSSQAVRESRR